MKKRSKLWRVYEIVALVLTPILIFLGLYQLGCGLMPKRTIYGAVWSSYLQEEADTVDVLFLGSSRCYCNVIPARIYETTGISTYVMAGPSQNPPLTYLYLRQCLRTQKPKYVLVEASGAFFQDPGKDGIANVCYMPLSADRVRAALCCQETDLSLALFPLEEFHSRIYEDREKKEKYDPLLLCGYTPLAESKPYPERTERFLPVGPGDETWAANLDSLRQIAALCAQENIPCIFFLAPMREVYPDAAAEILLQDLCAQPGALAEDWRTLDETLAVDPETGWYDPIHFNTEGALAFSDFLASYLQGLGLTATPNADQTLWTQRVAYLDSLRGEK